jgi:NAD(P)-dependent dehydrogenase (short-subunit alcohol dehydrogenase family)
MNGQVVLVTGSSSGIGRVTAVELARRGARVVLANRSAERTAPVLDQIRRGGGTAEFLELDLSRFASIRRAAASFLGRGLALNVLVDNAGLVARGFTEDGFELTFGVNHVGHFLLTTLLLDRLRSSAPARVVTVASDAHRQVHAIDFDRVRRRTASITAFPEYATSKLANVLFSAELGRRLAGSGVTTYAVHPGMVATEIWRRIPWPVRPLMKASMLRPEEGARGMIRCAADADVATESGLYYEDGRPSEPSRAGRDRALAAELWERSVAWCS